MVIFFKTKEEHYIAVGVDSVLTEEMRSGLSWLFGNAVQIPEHTIPGFFVGPRKEMLTPWSTNAVEICENMGITGLKRIEEYYRVEDETASYDPMLQRLYKELGQDIFTTSRKPEPIIEVHDIAAYNEKEGLALSSEEVAYLNNLSNRLGRKLTDSEVFGFSQVNSEHCRHKIFNGKYIIDGKEMPSTLFELIRKTTRTHPNSVVSAYKDNCSFASGPVIEQFAPEHHDKPGLFRTKEIESVLSLKAETHNFPTTVEPFNGAATGTGGEIRDRIAGGKGAIPMAGTAVYMTSYPRLEGSRSWENYSVPRKWLYQTPGEILIKASNGASDFGNKFGQPLICGSLLTFEHFEGLKKYGYDKVIMLAGGIGYGKKADSTKDTPEKGDAIIVLGGDNYRIGMGGGAVSSVATGEYGNAIELNAVQRANPEMQKRVYNAIRAISESERNTIVSIHDHGAGGHLNCLSELVEATGGTIDIAKLPIGDPTLSAREIAGNESQERMGLVLRKVDIDELRRISERERAPFYLVGEVTGDHRFSFVNGKTGERPIDLELTDLIGNPPQTVIRDTSVPVKFKEIEFETAEFPGILETVLQLEAVACKDWLTNKVDRSVTGKIAIQQCAGELQLPLNNLGVVALDYRGTKGYATSIGHAPAAGLIDPAAGSVLSIAESLTNIIWAPLKDGLNSVSLSANWMWPSKNQGEDARLYRAVEAASQFAIELGINIPTGKDSLSMTQKYPEDIVFAPGTVIISAAAEVADINKVVAPVLKNKPESLIVYVDFSGDELQLGGSSFAQVKGKLGTIAPTVKSGAYFRKAFSSVQKMISEGLILSGHDISAGGLITCLLEMCFSKITTGMDINITGLGGRTMFHNLFAENPGLVIQVANESSLDTLNKEGITYRIIGTPSESGQLKLRTRTGGYTLDIDRFRDFWYRSSWLLDRRQSGEKLASERYANYKYQPITYDLKGFSGTHQSLGTHPDRKKTSGIRAAILREKGVNGDREMAYAMHLAGMDVYDVHMTDLMSGRENLESYNMIVFVGGFSNSDVLGSAKGWAGAFRFNEKARVALENFYKRTDTLSLGVCNGCQLMVELGLVNPEHKEKTGMKHNASGKFESAFLGVEIQSNTSVMLGNMAGMKLGIWVAHGEGKFSFPYAEDQYHIPVKYLYPSYPGNPNGSDFSTAAICSSDGRHLAIMPHLERAFLPYQCAYYPEERKQDEVTPWLQAFVNARKWIESKVR
jgi:phosphoribosylformylglycinamidine synthase